MHGRSLNGRTMLHHGAVLYNCNLQVFFPLFWREDKGLVSLAEWQRKSPICLRDSHAVMIEVGNWRDASICGNDR
jgi:hypothetical protein